MRWFKNDRALGAFVLAVIGVWVVEGTLLVLASKQSRHAFMLLEQKQREREALQIQSPGSGDEMEEVVRNEIVTGRAALDSERVKLIGESTKLLASSPTTKSIDAYFEIADFVEQSRKLAAQAGVAIRPDERFGFSSHSAEGPEAESRLVVFRQRVALKCLIGMLMEARPAALFSVQRERPVAVRKRALRDQKLADENNSRRSVAKKEEPADFFDLAPAISVGLPGRVETEGFKFEFSGPTGVLRDFLNRLASGSVPFVVRSIEAEPLAFAPASVIGAQTTQATNSVTIVTQASSRFRVVVELITLLNETGEPQT